MVYGSKRNNRLLCSKSEPRFCTFFDAHLARFVSREVVLTARLRPTAKMTSSFDSATPILFHLSLTVEKLFERIDLAGNSAYWFQYLGFLGVLT